MTFAVFLHYYSQIAGKGMKTVFKLARAILDLCLIETWYGTVQPSHLASSALLAASHVLGKGHHHGHCTMQLMDKLVTLLDNVYREDCERRAWKGIILPIDIGPCIRL